VWSGIHLDMQSSPQRYARRGMIWGNLALLHRSSLLLDTGATSEHRFCNQ
jgi:hypothetical protein